MQIAFIGLPWTGKTTLFHTLTAYGGAGVPAAAPGTVARSVVRVPDPRLDWLHALWPTARKVPATVEYLDVPGLDVRREHGHGVPGTILAQIKNARALVEVIGGFAEDQPAALAERVAQWKSDADTMATEMLVSDLQIVENRRERLQKQMKKGKRPEDEREDALLQRCETALGDGRPLREIELSPEERTALAGFQLLTQKPLIQVINVSEELAAKEAEIGALWGAEPPIVIAARIEAEIAGLEPADRPTFLADLGLEAPALDRLVRASYRILGLIAFFTVGDDEVRAWTITAGTKAQAAAGEIHSDLERGFIRAEVVGAAELLAEGSLEACKKRGILRLEGKDYLVKDADVIAVRFSV